MSAVIKSSQNALTVSNLHYAINETRVLQAFNLEISAGETGLILGPSGSGKTTLLSILTGLQRPEHGTVCYDDTNLCGVPPMLLRSSAHPPR